MNKGIFIRGKNILLKKPDYLGYNKDQDKRSKERGSFLVICHFINIH